VRNRRNMMLFLKLTIQCTPIARAHQHCPWELQIHHFRPGQLNL